jgi:hypothetical protein
LGLWHNKLKCFTRKQKTYIRIFIPPFESKKTT